MSLAHHADAGVRKLGDSRRVHFTHDPNVSSLMLKTFAVSTDPVISRIALWKRDRTVTTILCFFCLGHWAILWRGMFIVHATFSSEAGRCIVTADDHVFLNVTFFTSTSLPCSKELWTPLINLNHQRWASTSLFFVSPSPRFSNRRPILICGICFSKTALYTSASRSSVTPFQQYAVCFLQWDEVN